MICGKNQSTVSRHFWTTNNIQQAIKWNLGINFYSHLLYILKSANFNNSAHLQIPVLLPGKLLPHLQKSAPCFRSDGILKGPCSFARSLPGPGPSITVVPAPSWHRWRLWSTQRGEDVSPSGSAVRCSPCLCWLLGLQKAGSGACPSLCLKVWVHPGPVRHCVLRSGCTQGLSVTVS